MQFENPRDHIIELEKRLDETENQLNELTTHVVTLENIMMAIAKAVLPLEDFEELEQSDDIEE
jgi:hypothetical protein